DIPTVENRVDEVAEMMEQPVDPHAVLSALEQTFESPPPIPTPAPSPAPAPTPAPAPASAPGLPRNRS
ncbi:MAG TPA: hypothetical protein VIY73_02080, partial [Polyangiaceae bacterium]